MLVLLLRRLVQQLVLLRKLLGVAGLLGKERNKKYPVYRKVRP